MSLFRYAVSVALALAAGFAAIVVVAKLVSSSPALVAGQVEGPLLVATTGGAARLDAHHVKVVVTVDNFGTTAGAARCFVLAGNVEGFNPLSNQGLPPRGSSGVLSREWLKTHYYGVGEFLSHALRTGGRQTTTEYVTTIGAAVPHGAVRAQATCQTLTPAHGHGSAGTPSQAEPSRVR